MFFSSTKLASHCVNGKDLPTTWSLTGVRLGEWDTATDVDCDDKYSDGPICNNPPVDVPIEKLIPHENYDPQGANQHNDIALLRLAHTVTYSDFIKPICLPSQPSLRDNDFVKQTLSVAGWGEEKLKLFKFLKILNLNYSSRKNRKSVSFEC